MCKNLKNFQCDGSHGLGGTIPSFLGQFPNLEFLMLDTCAFNGTLSMSLGNLQKLSFLDVNSNNLGGKIPTQLGKATSLKTLVLANNDFEGGVGENRWVFLRRGSRQGSCGACSCEASCDDRGCPKGCGAQNLVMDLM
ncbi:hypothetical protein ACHAWF_000886 [Thalassiosira exigua]